MTASSAIKDLLTDSEGVLGLSTETTVTLADLLEEAISSSSKARAGEIHDGLMGLYYAAYAQCMPEVLGAVTSQPGSSKETEQGFLMGQIVLAQLLSAQHLDRKVCEQFNDTLHEEANRPFIECLYRGSCNNKKLAKLVGQTEENVSRRLRKLREMGITSKRKVGTSVENFLTITAKSVIDESGLFRNGVSILSSGQTDVEAALAIETLRLDPFMQKFSPIGRSQMSDQVRSYG